MKPKQPNTRPNFETAVADMCIPPAHSCPESPLAALERIYEGNRRFAAERALAGNRDILRVREVATRQSPFAAFLGCADSRVPIEIIFDQGFGDLFVTRIAGNVASSEIIGSLEFATHILGAQVLYVLGHTNCGAVTATIQGEEVPGQISGLFQHIRPAVKVAKNDLSRAIEENVRNQAILIAESSPVIRRLVRHQQLHVAGGVYDLASGIVTPVSIELS
ncbi:carbonic anhydrase [Anatilimnocola floriformis]|uniref:carbonic anhydrase n=1 Tax=Anatilimnocola floriformis TaxID=2948575 RepID=UPI0020C5AD80|nr:carbonic anhydrase [Anatilimnocola floriformis]